MAEIWFYAPGTWAGSAMSAISGASYTNVGILHVVADLTVVTEAHPRKGVWCSARSKVRPPTHTVHVSVDDAWATRWIVQRWGVHFSWIDAAAFAYPKCASVPDGRKVTSAELARLFISDAASDCTSKAEIPYRWREAVHAHFDVSPTLLSQLLK
jgi:hypothetical protein